MKRNTVAGALSLIVAVSLVTFAETPEDAEALAGATDLARTEQAFEGVVPGSSRLKPAVPKIGQPSAGSSLTVELVVTQGLEGRTIAALSRAGIKVKGRSVGVMLVEVDGIEVLTLDALPGVEKVRRPTRVDLVPDVLALGDITGASDSPVSIAGADAWHSAGFEAEGVSVGVIDYFDDATWSTAHTAGAVPSPSGTFCQVNGSSCNIWSGGLDHGVGVAELIHEMAPAADLYLATAVSLVDLAAAIAWFDENGVDIISRSLVSALDSAGDGSGSINAVADDAVSRGMMWVNASGNNASKSGTSGGSYWRGGFVDSDFDGWLEFGPHDEALGFSCGFMQGFRWSDWTAGNTTDYDVYVTDFDDGLLTADNILSWSENDQGDGADPLEVPFSVDCDLHPNLNLWVRAFDAGDGTVSDVLEFAANRSTFEYSQNPYSASQPIIDSFNPGVVAVGAIDPPSGSEIGYYSSRGPTNDERIKPDISAPSCLGTVAYAPKCFNGTSAAAPVVSGAAALILGSDSSLSPAGLASALYGRAQDLGPSGPDSTFGAGRVHLGPVPNDPPVVILDAVADVEVSGWASLSGLVTDDGRPGSISTEWSVVSGPSASVVIDPLSQVGEQPELAVAASASFPEVGTYVLRLTASDSDMTGSQDVAVSVVVDPTPDRFVDVPEGHTFYDDIEWLAAMGITRGCNPPINDWYCPRRDITRGELSAFLARALELPPGDGDTFIDDDGHIFEGDIERLVSAGIIVSCNEEGTRFCPNQPLARDVMAEFLVSAFGFDHVVEDFFTDDDGNLHEDDINAVAAVAVTRGCNPPTNDHYCPDRIVDRAEMAAFFHRAWLLR